MPPSTHIKNKKWTIEQVSSVAKKHGYAVLDKKYKNQITKIRMVCPKKHETLIAWGSFLNVNQRCTTCYGRIRWNIYLVKKKALERGYIVLSENYFTNREKLEMICPEGHEISIPWVNFCCGRGCQECGIESMKRTKRIDFSEILNNIYDSGYEFVSGNYVDLKTKIILRCPVRHEYLVNMRDFRGGNRCPKCRNSKGESKISSVLDSYSIKYIRQKRFGECKDRNPLPFDFYIPSLDMCIEYQGEQHFKSVEIWGGRKRLLEQRRRDKIKSKFSVENDILLLAIPYWEFKDIEKILKGSLERRKNDSL